MQRRTGKGVAHISIPSPHMGGDPEKTPSRLQQKSLGVTNRIWLILLAFLALVLFQSRFVSEVLSSLVELALVEHALDAWTKPLDLDELHHESI